MSKQHKYQSANSTCKDSGHDWMTTTAANYRVCKREQCRASERLVDGQWVSNAKLYKFHDPVIEGSRRERRPRQTAMWDGGQQQVSSKEEYYR